MNKYTYTVGRRKTSVASVRLFKGEGECTINDKPLAELMVSNKDKDAVIAPLKELDLLKKYYFTAKVSGGGQSSQIGAVIHGLARGLVKDDESLKVSLRKLGFLSRDSRMVERKKIGLRKARKAPQYSKR